MPDFFATYSAASNSSSTVTANQGTVPWIVAGGQTAGASGTAVLTVQGIAGGTAMPISGSITATNPSVGATGASVPASGTYIAASVAGTLTGLVATANGLKVDGSAATQPISGTVAATQSGTWTVQPGNTANSTPWLATVAQGGNSATVSAGGALKVDASASTQPVSGTVTANQGGAPWTMTGTGTAGTAATGVLTVQGITSMTPLLVNGSGSTQPVSGTVTANAGTGTFTTDQIATTTATFQDGAIAFGSLTTNYQTVVTAGGALKNVSMRNNTTAVIVVSLNSGSSTSYTLDAGDFVSLDLKTLGLNIPSTTTLQAKYSGLAPTAGSIRINGVY